MIDATQSSTAKDGARSCELQAQQPYGGLRQTIDFGTTIPAGCTVTAEVWVRDGSGSVNVDLNLYPVGGSMKGTTSHAITKGNWKHISADLTFDKPTTGVIVGVSATEMMGFSFLLDMATLKAQ